jgi:hypothetical protein
MELNTPVGSKAGTAESAVAGFLAAIAGAAQRIVKLRNAATRAARRGVSTFSHGLFAGLVDWLEQVIENTLFPR